MITYVNILYLNLGKLIKRDLNSLSIEFRNDGEKYTDAKAGFIKDIVSWARKELKNKP